MTLWIELVTGIDSWWTVPVAVKLGDNLLRRLNEWYHETQGVQRRLLRQEFAKKDKHASAVAKAAAQVKQPDPIVIAQPVGVKSGKGKHGAATPYPNPSAGKGKGKGRKGKSYY
eukprot:TRINITY_DN4969_c0_g2_i3.p7 TRINITY_DN4969_c0_g2~~TRINITY_DN4969_c0_g2_i3.p7  ORF type:complete len:114 (+),score=12.87 TRINITY_DN4969_c0_g2_i3:699-1040(+)